MPDDEMKTVEGEIISFQDILGAITPIGDLMEQSNQHIIAKAELAHKHRMEERQPDDKLIKEFSRYGIAILVVVLFALLWWREIDVVVNFTIAISAYVGGIFTGRSLNKPE